MSKKDFIALADAIRDHNRVVNNKDRFTDKQLRTLASFCRGQNYHFMEERWRDYIAGRCGKNGGKIAA